MIIVYEAVKSVGEIRKKEFEKETKLFYIRENGMRDSKESYYSKFFKTFDEAKEFLLDLRIKEIEYLKKSIANVEKEIENIMGKEEM